MFIFTSHSINNEMDWNVSLNHENGLTKQPSAN